MLHESEYNICTLITCRQFKVYIAFFNIHALHLFSKILYGHFLTKALDRRIVVDNTVSDFDEP